MQQLDLEQRRLLGPRAPWHVGDVAWGLRQHEGREPEWTFRLWRDSGDRVVAWSWLKGDRGLLEYDVHPEHRHLLEESSTSRTRGKQSLSRTTRRRAPSSP